MLLRKTRSSFSALLFLPWLFALGCSSSATATPAQDAGNSPSASAAPAATAPDTSGAAPLIQAIAARGTLSDLHAPNFTDYGKLVQSFYRSVNDMPVWVRNGQPTPQALAVIAALQSSQKKGLNPEDYDASLWASRISALKASPGNADTIAKFDVALTVGTMRYISDLHIGRVNPKHFQFGIDIEQKKYDLPQLLLQRVIDGNNVPEVLAEVEPQYLNYKRLEAALQTYEDLAAQESGEKGWPLPEAAKPPAPGDSYAAIGPLADRLRLLGDLPPTAVVNINSGVYTGPLVDAVKHFQVRHGLTPDGKLGKETMHQLNTPLSVRVTQLEDALERWRWLPPDFNPLPVLVNIPEFVLRVFNPDHTVALKMNVIAGKAVGHQTPIFAQNMRYIVLRPYWNVPPSIARGEIVPHLLKDPGYLGKKGFEITDSKGTVVATGSASPEMIAQLRAGRLMVRQKPAADNALGLIKFIFPNDNNVYLHSTPSQTLFSQSRRDFSHGCIRVESPADLAAFLLKSQPNGQKWTVEAIKAAMQSGPDNQQINLGIPVPVVIAYLTAVVEEDGEVYFFNDIYGHDKSLNTVLAKGPPYPG
jgi:murein L,D-transpeptidase YcbB/YkuD